MGDAASRPMVGRPTYILTVTHQSLYITVMLNHPEELSIRELADTASVSVRTVRFYQQEGLLDAPGVRGVKSAYGESDIKRLELIKAYQREGYSLAGIRDRLQSMGEADIAQEIDRLRQGRGSAADYARSIRMAGERQAPYFRTQQARPPRDRPRSSSRSGETWERISLTPNLELHARSPLSHRETMLVSRLVELADRLINTQEGV